MSSCRPRPGPRRSAPSPTPTVRCRWAARRCRCPARRARICAIIQDLARRLGLDWNYSHPREVFAEMKQAMPSLDNITWDRLEREGSVTYPCDAEDKPGNDIVFGDGFPTPIGRGKLVPVRARVAGRGARRAIPDGAHHRPPARALAHRRDDAARQRARRARARGRGEPGAGRSAPHGRQARRA